MEQLHILIKPSPTHQLRKLTSKECSNLRKHGIKCTSGLWGTKDNKLFSKKTDGKWIHRHDDYVVQQVKVY